MSVERYTDWDIEDVEYRTGHKIIAVWAVQSNYSICIIKSEFNFIEVYINKSADFEDFRDSILLYMARNEKDAYKFVKDYFNLIGEDYI